MPLLKFIVMLQLVTTCTITDKNMTLLTI